MPNIIRAFLLIIGLVLVIDCTLLIAADKIDFGTIAPFFIAIIFIIHAVFWNKIKTIINNHLYLRLIWKTLWACFAVWFISFLAFAYNLKTQIQQVNNAYQNVDAIIILGGGIRDGIPTPTLAYRLDTAVPLIHQQPDAIVITTGGISMGETRSEGESMAQYLHALYGIPLDSIYQEKKSTSTEENFIFNKKILAAKGIPLDDPIVIVTSDFHIPRAKAIAEHQGFTHVITLASPTPLATRYNSWFREYFAYINGYLLDEYEL
ncbi:YdcF family protein [Psychrobacter sp.]|uniref:YdcF family protein n=1 Tax=Psychrobacter sp. TaxID=56811 RepID=UPI0025E90471|nr:YdcF family protein [Psychrobacter sp.]